MLFSGQFLGLSSWRHKVLLQNSAYVDLTEVSRLTEVPDAVAMTQVQSNYELIPETNSLSVRVMGLVTHLLDQPLLIISCYSAKLLQVIVILTSVDLF